jgi:hypothetical protein
MANDRIKRLERSLETVKQRRFEIAEALGREKLPKGQPEQFIADLLTTHEAVKVFQELIAEEEKMVSRH